MITALRRFLRRTAREERGAATVPFVLFVPVFMVFILSAMELGFVMMRHVMLDRALDLAVRDLRLGRIPSPDHAKILARMCAYSSMLPNCETTVLLELKQIPANDWTPFATGPTCVDRTAVVQPVTEFSEGTTNDLMLVRACAKFDPLLPTTGMGLALSKDASGAYALVVSAAFVNEPRPGT